MKKDYIFDDFRKVMIDALADFIRGESIAYIGMILILTAFFWRQETSFKVRQHPT